LLAAIARHGCCSLAGMLAHGINDTVLDLTTPNSIGANRIRFPYRFVLQDAPEGPKSAEPRRHFRWTQVVARSLRRLER
jgi:hypothetical protein